MQSSERIAALIAQHVPGPGRIATLPGPGSGAPPPLPKMPRLRARSPLSQAVDVTADAVADDDDGRVLGGGERFAFLRTEWSKWRSRLTQLRWPRRELSVRVGIAVVSLGLGLLLGSRPWQSPALTSKARIPSALDRRNARSTDLPTKPAARAALTTAGVASAIEQSPHSRALGKPRQISPVRIQASAQRGHKVQGGAVKHKSSAKHWGQPSRVDEMTPRSGEGRR
jgi:hypothetical protein